MFVVTNNQFDKVYIEQFKRNKKGCSKKQYNTILTKK